MRKLLSIAFSPIAIAVFSFIVVVPTAHALKQGTPRKTNETVAAQRFFLSAPVFLRPCVEELIKQWRKSAPKATVCVIDRKPGLDNVMIGNGHIVRFLIVPFQKGAPDVVKNRPGATDAFTRLGMVALAIYVNDANPLKGLTVTQIDAIFSRERRCGFPYPIETFGQIGLTGQWIELPISPFGVSFSPDILKWFRNICMCSGTLRNNVKLLDTRVDFFQAISTQPVGVGFYLFIDNEKRGHPVAISEDEGEDYFLPTPENIRKGLYPLSASLYARFDPKAIGEVGLKFLQFCLSMKGQDIMASYGVIPGYPKGLKEKDILINGPAPKNN